MKFLPLPAGNIALAYKKEASELIFTHHLRRISIFTTAQISKNEQKRDLSEIMKVIAQEVAKKLPFQIFRFVFLQP